MVVSGIFGIQPVVADPEATGSLDANPAQLVTPAGINRILEQKTLMFGVIALEDGELVALDGGIHRAAGHTARVLPDGSGRWERRVDTMGSDRRSGSGTLTLDAGERKRLNLWADAAWKLGDPANPWPPLDSGANPTVVRSPPPSVWAVLIRRGDVIRIVQGDTWIGKPDELVPLLDWLRERVDAAAGGERIVPSRSE